MFGLGKLRCNFLVIPVLWRFLQDLMLGQTQDCRSTSATREIIKMAMLWVPSEAPKASKLWTVVFSPRRNDGSQTSMLVASSAPEDLFWSLTSWKGQAIANWRHFEVSKLSTQTMNFRRLQLRRSTLAYWYVYDILPGLHDKPASPLVRRCAYFSFTFRVAHEHLSRDLRN